jgi:IS5 family transposase
MPQRVQAYASAEHVQLVAKRNTGNRILHKAKRNQPLSDRQKHLNRQVKRPQHRRARVQGAQAALRHRQGALPGAKLRIVRFW